MSRLHIYIAAAGAGKTHVLVSAYLQLALKSPLEFLKILAVTFTNRATQEMKQRILTSLHSMAQGIDTPLAQELLYLNKWDKNTLQARAQLVRSHILHQYDHFSISTIDSFLQTIVRNFSKELGIQHGFTLEMDQDAILEHIISEVIHTAGEDKQLRRWLVSFAEHKLLAGESWQFKQSLKQLGYELFTEKFSQQEAALVQALLDPHKLTTFLAALEACIYTFESNLQRLGKKAIQCIEEAGLTIADFSYGQRGVAGYLAGLCHKKKFTPTQRTQAALTCIEAWYSQASPQKNNIIEVVQSNLQSILQEIMAYYQAQHHIYHTGLAIQEFIYAWGIITHLLASLRKLRTEKNIMLVSDAANLLRQLIAENDTPFVYEKIGAFYNYFLIDEFQDISDFQWKNLKPLISNSLAAGHMSLLVGDVKQSVYRWRGGNWQLLSMQLAQEFTTLQHVLAHNWRSQPYIIHFNNTFFTQASEQLLSHLQQEIGQLADIALQQKLTTQVQEIGTLYTHTYQQVPHERLNDSDQGYVEVNFLAEAPEKANGSWKEQVKHRLPTLLETLQEDGFALQDMALLVRNHTEARELFQALLHYQHSAAAKPGYNYVALSIESLYVGHSPWVNILMSALGYLANQQDALAKTELIYLYQLYVCKNEQGISHDFFAHSLLENGDGLLPADFIAEFYNLAKLPLYERIIRLVAIFQLTTPASMPFIQAFLDIVVTYLRKNAGENYHFFQWWKEKGHKHSLPHLEGQDAISIMTIHQAKGLQFKVVIVPFCAWDFDHPAQKSPILWCSTEVEPFSAFPSLPLRYHNDLQETVYAQAYYEERIRVYVDHLNLLYVAFTRAKNRLYVFAQQPDKAAFKTTADLMYETIHNSQPVKDIRGSNAYFLNWEQYWQPATQQLIIGNPVPTNTIKHDNHIYQD